MHVIADTNQLVVDEIITPKQATTIESRARQGMIFLGINLLLCFGIISVTAGTIFWLADAIFIAISGTLSLIAGLLILVRGGAMFRMFGNAATLIGAGMLIGGAIFELIARHMGFAGWAMLVGGAVIVLATGL